ncbi:MAG: NRDE family protein [Balneolaceae bacterium]
MCLITFAYKAHPIYKLILASNRDEFYERPTRKAQFWKEEKHPELLAGKDLEAGGTWMGINKRGKWGALTNYRDPSSIRPNPPSRGELVLNYLQNRTLPKDELLKLDKNSDSLNGFNLLLGDTKGVFHYSNVNKIITEIKPGIHGVSNALLDTSWPKLDQAKEDLSRVIEHKNIEFEKLFELLKKEDKPPENELPNTGIPKEWEKAVSSVFIKTESYGTRCSTLLLIDNYGKVTFIERRYDPKTSMILEENTFKLVFS